MRTSQKALCYFFGLIISVIAVIIGSLWIWYMEVVIITLSALVSISFFSTLRLYLKRDTSFAFGLSMSLLALCVVGLFLLVVNVTPVISLDKIQYEDDTYVEVILEANTYDFGLNKKVFWIGRDRNCLCQIMSGPYDEIQWRKYGDNGLMIYVNDIGYLWEVGQNSSQACFQCDM